MTPVSTTHETPDDSAPRTLAGMLGAPAHRRALAELPARFPHVVIELTCTGAAALARDPAAPGRVRGALGEVLKGTASREAVEGRPCPWTPPCAFDPLYRSQGRIGSGLEIPKPFVLALDSAGRDLVVHLSLFGIAARYAESLAEALTQALRRGLRRPGGGRLDVGGRRIGGAEGIADWAPWAGRPVQALHLRFLSPFRVRDGNRARAGFAPLVSSLGNRVSGLARWMDIRVEADWRRLREAASDIEVTQSTIGEVDWVRASRKQHRLISMNGFVGDCVVEGDLTRLVPLLALGQLTHAGSNAALGLGRYEIAGARFRTKGDEPVGAAVN
jgi:hypothetical protein